MKRLTNTVPTPTVHPKEKPSPCKRSCCWSPYGHSAAAENCRCHLTVERDWE